jgi:hypothetical protein
MKSYIFWDIKSCTLCSQPTFRRNMSSPSSGSKNKPSRKALLAVCFTLVSCLAYSSTLKMEVACFSETLVDSQQTIRRYFSQDISSSFFGPKLFLKASVLNTCNVYSSLKWTTFHTYPEHFSELLFL